MSIWDKQYANEVAKSVETTIDLDVSEPLPAGSYIAIVTDVTSKSWEGEPEVITLQWRVVDGEYKNRIVFQRLRIYDTDQQKAIKAFRMLCAIDANCGGRFKAERMDATPENLKMAFVRRMMRITLKIWELNDKRGNFVVGIAPSSTPAPAAAPAAAPASAPEANQPVIGASVNPEDDDIPF
jgi:hypothetical protein